jgi:alanyl-tRNA synthetase
MGLDISDDEAMAYSMELCGGTHVRRTGDIGFFKIVSQGAISAGVRRIEALTGEAARQHVALEEQRLTAAANVLKVGTADLPERLAGMVEDRRRMERELTEARRKLALSGGAAAATGPEVLEVGGIRFLGQVLDGVSPKDLRSLIDDGKKTVGSGVVAFVAVADGKAGLAVGVTDDLTDRLNAVDMVRAGAEALGGKGGGGRPDMAQAGGPDAGKAPDALTAVEECLQSVMATV